MNRVKCFYWGAMIRFDVEDSRLDAVIATLKDNGAKYIEVAKVEKEK